MAEHQVRIENRDGKFMLRNLDFNVPVFLNRVEIAEAFINHRDEIQIGEHQFHFSKNSDEESTAAHRLISKNDQWNQELKSLYSAAQTDFPVLLLGPSGTGKDVLAHSLHKESSRRDGPFVSVNCSALTETLVESELFGHIKGSFTGAIQDRKGAFESARGGTLFLDEIGDLSKNLQAKILRALENCEIRPVGSDRTIQTNVRIIAATHQNLNDRIIEGQFRSDLYFRLNVVTAYPPALSQRMEDFESLFYAFCKQYRVGFSFDSILEFKKYTWPGNIRELKNLVARASALFPNQRIEAAQAQRLLGLQSNYNAEAETMAANPAAKAELSVIREIERQLIYKRLKANRGNQRRTAAELKMPKSTLFDRIKTYEIDLESLKA
jgi:transcriptional regulator with PAS, ATPase and Fis domain